MLIKIPLKPLSINAAFQGRRFKTREANQYDKALALLLPRQKVAGDYFRVTYRFYLKNFAKTDADNLVKCLQDCIVRKGIITDDRKIIDYKIMKFPSKDDRIEIEIEAVTLGLHTGGY